MDASGNGTGLLARLPGTGDALPADDPNLALDIANGWLNVLSTNSDLNGQFQLDTGEYLGVSLSDLGFTGHNNFSIQAKFQNVQYAAPFDQFGIYVAADSKYAFRIGWINSGSPNTIAVNTYNGKDSFGYYEPSLAPTVGDTVGLTLQRGSGVFRAHIYNLTHPARSGDFVIYSPTYFNRLTNLYVGIFAANARNDVAKTLTVDEFKVHVQ